MSENGFAQFDLDPTLLRTLTRIDYKEPTPVQVQTIPVVQRGCDLIALAHTGSGKTAACAIPLCNQLDVSRKDIQALVIVPTRELALQYATEAQKIGRDRGVKVFAILGGEKMALQQAKLRDGVQFLVATPGRLIDFIYNRLIDLSQVKSLVLDEADEMLSMGFYEDLEFIMQCLVQQHQTLLFSATMPPAIRKLALRHMKEPLEIALTHDRRSPEGIDHLFIYCSPRERDGCLEEAIRSMEPKQCLIFCRSRIEVERLARYLKDSFDKVDYLHGGMSQGARSVMTARVRSGKIHILVATDIAARGLDFTNVSHVFMYHLPNDPEVYVHRAGRTGRFFRKGSCVTLVTPKDLPTLDQVIALVGCEPKWLGPEPEKRPPPPRGKPTPSGRSRAPRQRNNGSFVPKGTSFSRNGTEGTAPAAPARQAPAHSSSRSSAPRSTEQQRTPTARPTGARSQGPSRPPIGNRSKTASSTRLRKAPFASEA